MFDSLTDKVRIVRPYVKYFRDIYHSGQPEKQANSFELVHSLYIDSMRKRKHKSVDNWMGNLYR